MEFKEEQTGFVGKKREVPIEIFEIMYEILKQNKLTEMKWAEASGLPLERISDFKRMAGKTKKGANEGKRPFVAGRRFSLEKSIELGLGLRKIVSDMELKKGLRKQLDEIRLPTRTKVFMRLLVFNETQMRQLDMYTDALLRADESYQKSTESV